MEIPRYRAAVGGALPWIAGFVAIALLLAAALSPLGGRAEVVASLAVAVPIGIAALLWLRRPPAASNAYPMATTILLAPAFLLGWRLATGTDPAGTVGFVLLLVAVGAVLLDTAWAAGAMVALWGIWIAAAVVVDRGSDWVTWVVAMISATLLGSALHVSRRRSLDALDSAVAEARAASVTDALTGVANRRGLLLAAGPMVESARRAGAAVHCLFLDIDGFKRINDECGHAAGDDVLLGVAEALVEATRGTDVVARWGGDEFVVLGPGTGMAPLELERRVAARLQMLPVVPAEVWDGAVSVGTAQEPPWEQDSIERLVEAADQAMYRRRDLLRRSRRVDEPPSAPPAEPTAPSEPGVG